MEWVTLRVLAVAGAAVVASPAVGSVREELQGGRTPPDAAPSSAGLETLPAYFEENRGQTDPRVRYLARARGYRALFTDEEILFVLPHAAAIPLGPRPSVPAVASSVSVVRMRFEGVQPFGPRPEGAVLPGRSHYFLGNEPARWVTGVPHFGAIRSNDPTSGIDVRWRGLRGGALEYELVVSPGADPTAVALRFEGADSMRVVARGDLLLGTPGGVLRQSAPVAWQESRGQRQIIQCAFVVLDSGRVGFRLGVYDRALPLVVDPRVEFATYLGGTSAESVTSVATDSTGATYLVGSTPSSDYPLSSAYQGSLKGTSDAFVSKLDATASSLVYSTYLGGGSGEAAQAIAVDSSGAAYVVGQTGSTDFPVQGAIQGSLSVADDAFVTKLNAAGSALVYSTYLGGFSLDYARAVAVDSSGAAYVAGSSASTNFPLAGTLPNSTGGSLHAFVSKVNPSGTALVYSARVGGTDVDQAYGIAVDANGGAFVVGETNSTNFPLQGAFQGMLAGDYDAFALMVNAAGSALSYSSYLGGSGVDRAFGVVVDGNGVATLVGETRSTNFPTASPLYGSNGGGTADAFVARVAANGSGLSFSTYVGGSGFDYAYDLALDTSGSCYVAGATGSSAFPSKSAVQPDYGGGTMDAFVLKLNPGMTDLVYSTFLGGSGLDEGRAVALHGTDAVVVGNTASSDFPTVNPYQGTPGTLQDSFVVKVITTPVGPSGLDSLLVAIDGIQLSWMDNSDDETGFELQRKIGNGAWSTHALLPPDTTGYDDLGIASGTRFTYRVRAVNDDGVSPFSGETTKTTPPAIAGLPLAPSGLAADLVSSVRIDLTWTDESDDETFFQVQRMVGTGSWAVLATPGPGATSYTDDGALPDRTYSYRVRAANGVGFSSYSEIATTASPPSLDVSLTKGLIKDSTTLGKDVVKLSGTLAANGNSPDGAYDPVADGFELRLGGRDGLPLIALGPAPGTEGWVVRDGRVLWKSPRGTLPKLKLVVDPAAGTWTVKMKRATLPPVPANPIELWFSIANDAGTQSSAWTPVPRKTGVLRFP